MHQMRSTVLGGRGGRILGGVSFVFVGDWLGWCSASTEDWGGGRLGKQREITQ